MSGITSEFIVDGARALFYGHTGNKRMADALRAVSDKIASAEDVRSVWVKRWLAVADGGSCDVNYPGAALCAEGHVKLAAWGDANYVDEWRALGALALCAEDALGADAEPGAVGAIAMKVGLERALPWAELLLSRGAVREDCVDPLGANFKERIAAGAERDKYYWPLAHMVNSLNDADWMTADLICRWFRTAAQRLER